MLYGRTPYAPLPVQGNRVELEGYMGRFPPPPRSGVLRFFFVLSLSLCLSISSYVYYGYVCVRALSPALGTGILSRISLHFKLDTRAVSIVLSALVD